jgi:hypothetical protein
MHALHCDLSLNSILYIFPIYILLRAVLAYLYVPASVNSSTTLVSHMRGHNMATQGMLHAYNFKFYKRLIRRNENG